MYGPRQQPRPPDGHTLRPPRWGPHHHGPPPRLVGAAFYRKNSSSRRRSTPLSPPEKVPSVPLADTTLQSLFFFHVTAYWETIRHPSRGAHTACQPGHGHIADAAGRATALNRIWS